jgi:outer membrane protein assembly factor BamB
MFRNNSQRTGSQAFQSPLSDPARVPSLAVRHQFPAAGAPALSPFVGSPVATTVGGHLMVFIGNGNGRFYALDGDTLALVWQYPAAGVATTLTSTFTCNPSSIGIASSAVITTIAGKTAVVFGAPDSSGGSLGDGRLFALDAATGALIWRSDVVASLTGTTSGSTAELHEQIGFSSPLVWNNHVYVGVANHCDDPIQKGRVRGVSLATGALDPAFQFCSVATCGDNIRGGGIWSSVAALSQSLYVTTGNVRESYVSTEPSPDYAMSLVAMDQSSGAHQWHAQAVPFAMDADPDFAATVTLGITSCGQMAMATEKDGWTHVVHADGAQVGQFAWSFPPHAIPFTPGDGTVHGDDDYKRSGALWGDVYIAMNGGWNLTATSAATSGGLQRLHAFNVCDPTASHLRWLVDVPGTSGGGYALGHPTVSRGIVYVGTDRGHLVAIADPSVVTSTSARCGNPDVPNVVCTWAGYPLVPVPTILADVTVPDNGAMVYTEPSLVTNGSSDGRVYVATGAGHVYELTP